MATPIGHTVAGFGAFLLTTRGRRPHGTALMFLCMFFAVAPDLDFLPGLLVGQPARFHQGLSHSVGATVLAGLLGATLFRKLGPSFAAVFFMLAAAYFSHLILDLFGADGRPPYGLPLLWPLNAKLFLSPLPLLPGVHHAASAETATVDWLLAVFSWRNVLAAGLEVIVVSPFLLLAYLVRSRRRRAGIAPPDLTESSHDS